MATSTTTSAIPMPTKAAVFSRRTSRCTVKAVATSPPRTNRFCSEGRSKKDYYTVLSLEHRPDVGAEEIKHAYRRLALRYHPDVCPPSRRAESTELFLELQRAYETLSDPARKVRYDAGLRDDDDPAGAASAFARDVWEAQLCALRARSQHQQRQRARSCGVRPRPAGARA